MDERKQEYAGPDGRTIDGSQAGLPPARAPRRSRAWVAWAAAGAILVAARILFGSVLPVAGGHSLSTANSICGSSLGWLARGFSGQGDHACNVIGHWMAFLNVCGAVGLALLAVSGLVAYRAAAHGAGKPLTWAVTSLLVDVPRSRHSSSPNATSMGRMGSGRSHLRLIICDRDQALRQAGEQVRASRRAGQKRR